VVVEDAAGRLQQGGDLRIAHPVADGRALLATAHDVLGSQDGELLGDDRLLHVERALQLEHAALAADEQLQDADPERMGQRLEELGLERLQLSGERRAHVILYSNIHIQWSRAPPAAASPAGVRRPRMI
jgi:hypothetical protein